MTDMKMNGKAELKYLKKFAEQSYLGVAVFREQLRCLWTAYCLHNCWDCDTSTYDNDLLALWQSVAENGPDTEDWDDFDSFDLYMCRYLV